MSFDSLGAHQSGAAYSVELCPSLPVRYVWRVVDESVDHPTESKETLVDHTRFPCTLVLCTGTPDVLRTSEVDQVKLSDTKESVASGGSRRGVDCDAKDGMGSIRVVVELGRRNLSPVATHRMRRLKRWHGRSRGRLRAGR